MLTKVILDGVMGKKFGRKWNLAVNSPSEALRMIDANKPGVFAWIRSNLKKYENYRVICEYENGVIEELNSDNYEMTRKMKTIRFTPLISGSGSKMGFIGQIVTGIVMIVAAFFTYGQSLWYAPYLAAGMALTGAISIVGGVVGMLSSQPKLSDLDENQRRDGTSHYFDGPVNTGTQGVPVQLIYGPDVLVGSHPINVIYDIDEKVQ